MARTSAGHETRERLIRAAEELFATRGVEASLTKDIVRLAGQSNPSAVQYHFGSREGLLDTIMAARQERTERALAPRLPTLAEQDLPGLLDALVTAEATELRTEQGRHCLRISAQISHSSGVRTRTPHPTLAGGGYWRLIALAEQRISGLPEPIRLERLDLVLTLIGAALADRAQQYLTGSTSLTDEETFLADLVTVSAAMLSAPTPSRSTS
ncbi:TetR family transcriptional regulator [Kitasatospora purpeofusca]|uniref:TetR/AcrR family transcriptional regulator n=1 Tax=Kitasatospora purpeofusca TaxID=67352 RepID=UPI002E14A0F3|nr:TetR family transcriptional regulator [Kitasatospora purpeofusca]WSR30072.1 TetR family transcriptional regulator [Kitasatospora purpeofusca]WSR38308.1 TetR family transcriptional regulator [Kitasatospora purpeofusca]